MHKPLVTNRGLLADALAGLRAQPKRMHPKWFYDKTGSALFERITRCCQTDSNQSHQGQYGCPLCRAESTPLGESGGGCWQTNSNQSPLGQQDCPLFGTKTAPLSESGGTSSLEVRSAGETAFLVEVVRDRGMDGGEFLKTSHPPETKHRPLASSEREV